MMRKRSGHCVTMVALLASVGVLGCELALDFDRTKIDGGGIDASLSDAPFEAAGDVGTDAPPADAGQDAAGEAGADAGNDSGGADTGSDAADAAG
jgi:hypothetical protein